MDSDQHCCKLLSSVEAFLREGSLQSLQDANVILEAMPVQLPSLSEAALVLNDPVLDVALMLRLFEALKACAENERIPKDDAVLCACVCAIACHSWSDPTLRAAAVRGVPQADADPRVRCAAARPQTGS